MESIISEDASRGSGGAQRPFPTGGYDKIQFLRNSPFLDSPIKYTYFCVGNIFELSHIWVCIVKVSYEGTGPSDDFKVGRSRIGC